ncbi:MAG TPA: DUF4142 domain-containing protein [Caulobacterales bacterium]|nr:DUF4142 domain-containing protein [Caulobacterales bacterium]
MLRKSLIAASALGLAAACGQQSQQAAETSEPTQSVAEVPAAAPAPTAPSAEDFVQKVANSDSFEIQAAQLALTRSSNTDVKSFARMMRTDHTATTRELTDLAPTVNLQAPTPALDADQQAKLENLRNATGTAFDSLYIDLQVQAHQDAVSLFDSFANSGQGPLQQWAQTTLPKLRTHLDRAQALKNAA